MRDSVISVTQVPEKYHPIGEAIQKADNPQYSVTTKHHHSKQTRLLTFHRNMPLTCLNIHTNPDPLLRWFGYDGYHFQNTSTARHGNNPFFAFNSKFGVPPTWWRGWKNYKSDASHSIQGDRLSFWYRSSGWISWADSAE